MLAREWAPDDKAVLGSWLERAPLDQYVLAIWPVGPMMATRPERVIFESSGVNFWQARYSPNNRWVSFVATRMRNPGCRSDRDRGRAQQSRHDVDADTGRSRLARQAAVVAGWADAVAPSHGELTATSTYGACPSTQRVARRAGSRLRSRISARPIGASIPMWGYGDFDVASGKLVLPMQNLKGSIWILSGVSP